MSFAPAQRTAAFLRVGLGGPTGSGKSYTGIRLGLLLCKEFGGKLAVIDTEDKSASLYQGIEAPDGVPWEFDVCDLVKGHRAPQDYIRALNNAADAKYGVVLIDSITHAWTDMLAQVDKKAGDKENSFTAWRSVTPQHSALVDAITGYPGHIIFTVRMKMEYVLEKNEKGKMEPRKVGLAPVFRDGIEYESTVFADLDQDHTLRITKTRISALDGLVVPRPGPELSRPMIEFMRSAPPPPDHDNEWLAERERFEAGLLKLETTLEEVDTERAKAGKPPCRQIGHAGRVVVIKSIAPPKKPAPAAREPGSDG